MVLGSAQYRRQSDEAEISTAEDEISLNSEATPQVIIREDNSNGGMGFVDSTIRYHLPGSTTCLCWSLRSRLEKALIVLTIILTGLCIALLFALEGDKYNLHVTSHKGKVCMSQECIKVAANIISSADFSVDPCDDFYDYSCGGWEKNNPIPDGRNSWSIFEKLWEQNQLVMKNAIEEVAANKTFMSQEDDDAIRKVVNFYESCMDPNGTIIEARGGQPLLSILNDKKIGGWKLLEEDPVTSISDMKALQDKFQYLQNQYQVLGFFSWTVAEDQKNSTYHVIQIDQGGLSLPTRDYYLNVTDENAEKVIKAFEDMVVEVAKLLITENESEDAFTEEREKRIRHHAKDIIDFETKLANITIPSSKRRNDESLYHSMTIGTFQRFYNISFLNWTEFFNSAFNTINRTITPDERIIVNAPTYIKDLSDLINDYMEDSEKRLILENYMIMQVVKSFRNSLSKPYRDAGKSLETALYGKESHLERWRICIADTDTVLGFALGSLFIKKSFKGNSKSEAQIMIDAVKKVINQRLMDLKWMDKETKHEALVKANAITDMIGYPDYILDAHALDEKYRKLKVIEDDHFQNTLHFHAYNFERNLIKIDQPVNRTRWSMTPQTVNAYYTPTKNQIVFPAGILQNPFFNHEYPKSLNFGAIGVVMGHELSHAFDDEGSDYDAEGNMRNWWNNKTMEKFKKKTSCMQKQYSVYHPIPSEKQAINGDLTLGENIADNGGVTAAYYAYKLWLKERKVVKENPLPGIELSNEQLFFLSFAQVWCSVSTPQAMTLHIREDPHSPPRYRVIGVLSNSKEFSKAFNCPINSTMNPENKCSVW